MPEKWKWILYITRMSGLYKITKRLIRNTPGRFLALTAIVLLGTAFYIGVSAISSVMSSSVNKYDRQTNLKDITIYSNYGFDDEDIRTVSELDYVEKAEGSRFVDVYIEGDDKVAKICRVHSYNPDATINQFVLRSGRLPEAKNEVLADNGSQLMPGYALGTVLKMRRPDDDLSDYLSLDEVVVVGTIDTPLYLNFTKEPSTLLNQNLEQFIYIPDEAFVADYFTEMNIILKDSANYDSFSDSYRSFAEAIKEELKQETVMQADHRRDVIIEDAMEEYNDGLEKYEDGLKEYEEGVEDGQKEIDAAEKKLSDGWTEVNKGRKKLTDAEAELAQARTDYTAQIEENRKKIEDGWAELNSGKAKLLDAEEQLENARKTYTAKIQEKATELANGWILINAGKKKLEDSQNELDQANKTYTAEIDANAKQIADGWLAVNAGTAKLEQSQKELDEANKTYTAEIDANAQKLADGWTELNNGIKKLEDSQKELDSTRDTYTKQIEEGKQKIADGWVEYEAGKAEFEAQKAQYETIRAELSNALEQLNQPLVRSSFSLLDALNYLPEEHRGCVLELLDALGIDPSSITAEGVLTCLTSAINESSVAEMNEAIRQAMEEEEVVEVIMEDGEVPFDAAMLEEQPETEEVQEEELRADETAAETPAEEVIRQEEPNEAEEIEPITETEPADNTASPAETEPDPMEEAVLPNTDTERSADTNTEPEAEEKAPVFEPETEPDQNAAAEEPAAEPADTINEAENTPEQIAEPQIQQSESEPAADEVIAEETPEQPEETAPEQTDTETDTAEEPQPEETAEEPEPTMESESPEELPAVIDETIAEPVLQRASDMDENDGPVLLGTDNTNDTKRISGVKTIRRVNAAPKTFRELAERMGNSNRTFNILSVFIRHLDIDVNTGIDIINGKAQVILASESLINTMIHEPMPESLTIGTLAAISPEAERLKEELGLTDDTTIGEVKAVIASNITQIDEGIAEGQAKLDAGRKQLEDGQAELDRQEAELNRQLKAAQEQIDSGWTEVNENRKKLEDGETEIAAARKELSDKISSGQAEINKGWEEVKTNTARLKNGETELNKARRELTEKITAGQAEINKGWAELNKNIALAEDGERQLNEGRAQLEKELAEGQRQIDEGWAEVFRNTALLEDGQRELDNAQAELNKKLADGEREIQDGWKTLRDSIRQLLEGRRTLAASILDFEKLKADGKAELDEAKQKLDDALEEIQGLEAGEWMVLDRSQHYSSETYRNTIQQMKAIASIFPVFFIAVAALVCLTTMTRLVNEERGQIGILRGLGYRRMQCSMIYLSYAAAAGVIGCVFGTVLGLLTFPAIIYNTWKMLYILPPMEMAVPWKLIFIAGAAFILMMIGVTAYVLYDDMNDVPAVIMRPKAPKIGKDILLEKISFIWNRLSFSWKVTIRNLARYKRRMLMTVLGVGGCTALLVTGFGISDSVRRFVDIQYNEIVLYDGSIGLKEGEKQTRTIMQISDDVLAVDGIDAVHQGTEYEAGVRNASGKEEIVTVDMFDNAEQSMQIINTRDRISHDPIMPAEGSVILSEKTAENLGVRQGDSIFLESRDGVLKEVQIGGIMENYVFHRIVMTKDTYRGLYGTVPADNRLYVTGDYAVIKEGGLTETISKIEGVDTVSFVDNSISDFDNMINGINGVVYVLVAASMGLAFVVLGNLTNVNISERLREIATLKVLGFRKGEVENYIFNENNVLVAIGALVGLPIGRILERFIMLEVELNNVMYARQLRPMTYVLSFMLTLLFGLLVNFFMRRKLQNVKMVESLKSVE